MNLKTIVIIGLIILAYSWYTNPEKTKETLHQSMEKGESIAGGITNYFTEGKIINLGKPTLPCKTDEDCNGNIEKCENACECIEGDCIKNY